MRILFLASIICGSCSIAFAADKKSDSDHHYIKAEVLGKLISAGDQKKKLPAVLQVGAVRWQLLLPKSKKFADAIRELEGKEICVTGSVEIRPTRSKSTIRNDRTHGLEFYLRLTSIKYEVLTGKQLNLQVLNPDYVKQIGHYFEIMDANKNGELDRDEWKISRRIGSAFRDAGIRTDRAMSKSDFVKNYLKVFPKKE